VLDRGHLCWFACYCVLAWGLDAQAQGRFQFLWPIFIRVLFIRYPNPFGAFINPDSPAKLIKILTGN
jgi:hypothetical protein